MLLSMLVSWRWIKLKQFRLVCFIVHQLISLLTCNYKKSRSKSTTATVLPVVAIQIPRLICSRQSDSSQPVSSRGSQWSRTVPFLWLQTWLSLISFHSMLIRLMRRMLKSFPRIVCWGHSSTFMLKRRRKGWRWEIRRRWRISFRLILLEIIFKSLKSMILLPPVKALQKQKRVMWSMHLGLWFLCRIWEVHLDG